MILETSCLDERCLNIYERDIVNGGNVLILKVYCIRRNNGMWEFPAPQIFNDIVYTNNRQEYDNQIQAFRNDCQGKVDETSLALTQIENLKSEILNLKSAIGLDDTEE